MHLLCRGRVSGPSSAQGQHHSWQVSAPLSMVGTFSFRDGETTAFLVFSSVSLYSLLKAFHVLWSNFSLLPLSNFLLDLTTLLWLPFWPLHLTACLCCTLSQIVRFSPTEGFERRPSSGEVQDYPVFPHWDTCSYIQYKTYLVYSNKIPLSYVQPVAHFPKTPPDLIIPWCDCAKVFFAVQYRIFCLTSEMWVRIFLKLLFFKILSLCINLHATSSSFMSLAKVPSFLFPGCYRICEMPSDLAQTMDHCLSILSACEMTVALRTALQLWFSRHFCNHLR